MFVLGFVIGIVIGCITGVFVSSLCKAASTCDDMKNEEKEENKC